MTASERARYRPERSTNDAAPDGRGSAGSPTTVSPAALVAGFHDSYFFTDPDDGAMTFWDPESGVTTADSSYPTGGQTSPALTNVPLGTRFSYTIQLTGDGTITAMTFTMPSSFSGYSQYFKAGDYDQTAGTDATVGATVRFYSLASSR